MSRGFRSHRSLFAFIFLSAISCVAPGVRAEVARDHSAALPAATTERIRAASDNPAFSAWQRELMRSLVPDAGTASTLDGEWSEMVAPARAEASVIYDPLRDRIVVFGG